MQLQSGPKFFTLCCVALSAALATAAFAQTPKVPASSESYIIKLKLPEVDSPDAMAARKSNVLHSAAYWDNLYNMGTVALLGSAQKGNATYRVAIVEGVTEDQAQTIANEDPNVRAGAVTAEVIALHVEQAKNTQGKGLPSRR
jgi:uncharacterized protein YciI